MSPEGPDETTADGAMGDNITEALREAGGSDAVAEALREDAGNVAGEALKEEGADLE